MRSAILVSILTAVLMVGAAAVFAGPPLNGIWKSTDGDFDEGTAATENRGDYLHRAGPGRLYARSHDGVGFTNDWIIQCPITISVTPLGPSIGPNGYFTYMIRYTGGFLTLGGPGTPWDGGDLGYIGTLDTYVEIRTIQTSGGLIVGAVSDHAMSARIQGYDEQCVTWGIGNGVLRGAVGTSTPMSFDFSVLQAVKGPEYPGFPDNLCKPLPSGRGPWEDFRDLTLVISGCTVATEQSTWGNVKAMYRN